MARFVELHPADPLRRNTANDRRLEEYLSTEVEQALSARHPQEEMWREVKRQYAGIPRNPYRNTPVPNAPNIEVPLGAIATDAQYASITDTLYSGSPVLTARELDEQWTENAKAAQRWVNYCAEHEFGLREATDHSFFDTCQLGTGAFYIPFVEDVYRTSTYKVRRRGPRILPVAPENVLLPGGARGNIELERWVALRFWYHPDEMRLRAKLRGWDMEAALPIASIDWVRQRHEHLAGTDSGPAWKEMYEVLEFYAHFDYHNDGEALDLLVTWDRSSRKLLDLQYNPYDTRPIELMRYQLRPHLAYGLGIMEMMRPMQDEATEIHNHRLVNMMIANARVWIALNGTVPETMEIWPNKVIEVGNIDGLKPFQMGDIYPSSLQAEIAVTALAERRVGTDNSGAGGRPAMGTRTPGITALSNMQAQNRRFTPAFDQMRLGACAAVRQGLLRQRERLLAGDRQVEEHIAEVIGDADAQLVVELLRQPHFERFVQVEFTAVSPSVNREADRQNAIMIGQMFKGYYSESMQLLVAALNPQAPPQMVELAKQTVEKSTELMDRLARTFEQLRDPRRFLLDIGDLQPASPAQQGLQGLTQMLTAGVGTEGGQPPAAPPVDIGTPQGTA